MQKISTQKMVIFGIIASLYVVLTYALGSISYMGVQFRVSEALVLLCFYKKDYIFPLTLGCFIANLFSPMLAWDLTAGVFATFLSLFLISKSKNIYLASLFPVIINAVIVSIGLKIYFEAPFWLSMLQVAIGEFVCVSVVGIVVFKILELNKRFMKIIKFE